MYGDEVDRLLGLPGKDPVLITPPEMTTEQLIEWLDRQLIQPL